MKFLFEQEASAWESLEDQTTQQMEELWTIHRKRGIAAEKLL